MNLQANIFVNKQLEENWLAYQFTSDFWRSYKKKAFTPHLKSDFNIKVILKIHTSGVISLYKTQKVLTDAPNTSQYSSTKGCDKHYFNKLFWLHNKETTQELFAD